MPEIGPTLREARMRARIDISEIETTTKIRAKYLRALENEEWDLLPGPTYVKTFLRTYAEALGLDAKLMVEEYKLRHERPSDAELRPIAPPRSGRRAGTGAGSMRAGSFGGRRGRGVPRGYLVGAVVVLVLGLLYALSYFTDEEPATTATTTTTPAAGAGSEPAGDEAAGASDGESGRERRTTRRRSRTVRLQIIPRGEVFVCLVDRTGRVLVNGATLRPGDRTDTFRSRRFRLALGNNNVTLRINGRNRSVPPSDRPILYDITRGRGRRALPASSAPSCAA